jgi:hypothetical protein
MVKAEASRVRGKRALRIGGFPSFVFCGFRMRPSRGGVKMGFYDGAKRTIEFARLGVNGISVVEQGKYQAGLAGCWGPGGLDAEKE